MTFPTEIRFFLNLFISLASLSLTSSVQDLHCIMWGLSLWCMKSLIVAFRLSSCNVGLVVLQHVGSPTGIKLVSPTLEGRFLTTGPPRKSQKSDIFACIMFATWNIVYVHHNFKIIVCIDLLLLQWFDFMMLQKWHTFSKKHISNFACWSFSRLALCNVVSSGDSGL